MSELYARLSDIVRLLGGRIEIEPDFHADGMFWQEQEGEGPMSIRDVITLREELANVLAHELGHMLSEHTFANGDEEVIVEAFSCAVTWGVSKKEGLDLAENWWSIARTAEIYSGFSREPEVALEEAVENFLRVFSDLWDYRLNEERKEKRREVDCLARTSILEAWDSGQIL